MKMEPEILWCKGFCQSFEPEDKTGYTKRISYYERDVKIEVRVGNEKFIVNVHTYLYEKTYAEEKMKKYVDEHITQNMTELEKMQEIMDFISMTKYSYNSSSYIGLVAGDGADCWGDTAAILYMSSYAGIKAHARNANRDSGAGSGHRNVAAVLDGTVYIVDVMSIENVLRLTEITPTQNGFSVSGFGTVTQYDGYDEIASVPESPYIPRIGDFAMYYGKHSETEIKEVYVPKMITEIGISVFSAVDTLQKVVIDLENPNYKNIGNNVYSKDGSILYSYPAGQQEENFQIPKVVKKIDVNAFWGASALKNIKIPNGMKTIGEKAFVNTSLKEAIIPASVTEIGNDAFPDVELIVKSKNVILGQGLCDASHPIHGYKGSTAETYAQENNCLFIEIPVEDYMKGDFD